MLVFPVTVSFPKLVLIAVRPRFPGDRAVGLERTDFCNVVRKVSLEASSGAPGAAGPHGSGPARKPDKARVAAPAIPSKLRSAAVGSVNPSVPFRSIVFTRTTALSGRRISLCPPSSSLKRSTRKGGWPAGIQIFGWLDSGIRVSVLCTSKAVSCLPEIAAM